jgi:hypothetical protein
VRPALDTPTAALDRVKMNIYVLVRHPRTLNMCVHGVSTAEPPEVNCRYNGAVFTAPSALQDAFDV